MEKITATIITFNEENNIERCLQSLEGIADEIVVVDSFSTDKTKEICQRYPVTFYENDFKGHIEQKNFAITKATHQIILSLDADEALDEKLKSEIIKVKGSFHSDAYSFNRLTNYAGHWVRHCGWYPDTKTRLFKKEAGQWGGVNPHDIIELNSGKSLVKLHGDLLHYSYDSISDHINQTNKFTTIAAKAAYEKGVRSSTFKIVTRPFLKFIRDYFWKLGLLDGRYGFVICYINALSAFLKYAKIKELQEGKKI
ncbi:MAG: glycosyltransferase family 2 protein [Deltaproteobacteria bacterium]|nr:MAG: glycosyltransferase family 2 protein [Deltaproteobacteria bacterium]TNF28812.1 MAG: glycosyltransferase family 2 protein [Deltaproteobacteria bacterium]